MNFNGKTISIFGLIGFFLFFTVFCCCLTKTLEAAENQPSCHQAQQESQSTNQDSDECDCDSTIALLNTGESISFILSPLKFVSIDQSTVGRDFIFFDVQAYQAHPPPETSTPLYLQYSILRI